MAIEDFEWEGEIELTQPSQAKAKQAGATASAQGSWLGRLRGSVWLEPALRVAGVGALLGILAGIGVVATTYAKPGHELPQGPRELAAVLGTSWLKPTPQAPHDEHAKPASSGARAAASPSATLAAPAAAAPSSAPGSEPAPAAAGGVLADGRIVLNLASAEELTRLPGIGLKRAQAIVALRTKLKRFRQVTDLLRVKGIGPRGLKRMLPHLVLDSPA